MAEKCECSMKTEFDRIRGDITDIKNTVKEDSKEQSKEMLSLLESKIRTEIALESIKVAQEKTNETQILMMAGIKEIKDEPFLKWKKLSWLWKGAAIVAVVNWVIGNGLGYLKVLKIIE